MARLLAIGDLSLGLLLFRSMIITRFLLTLMMGESILLKGLEYAFAWEAFRELPTFLCPSRWDPEN